MPSFYERTIEFVTDLAELWFKVLNWSVIIGILRYAVDASIETEVLVEAFIDFDIARILYHVSVALMIIYVAIRLPNAFIWLNTSRFLSYAIAILLIFVMSVTFVSATRMFSVLVSETQKQNQPSPE